MSAATQLEVACANCGHPLGNIVALLRPAASSRGRTRRDDHEDDQEDVESTDDDDGANGQHSKKQRVQQPTHQAAPLAFSLATQAAQADESWTNAETSLLYTASLSLPVSPPPTVAQICEAYNRLANKGSVKSRSKKSIKQKLSAEGTDIPFSVPRAATATPRGQATAIPNGPARGRRGAWSTVELAVFEKYKDSVDPDGDYPLFRAAVEQRTGKPCGRSQAAFCARLSRL